MLEQMMYFEGNMNNFGVVVFLIKINKSLVGFLDMERKFSEKYLETKKEQQEKTAESRLESTLQK